MSKFHQHPIKSMFVPKFMTQSLFGHTWKPLVVFLGLFYFVLIIYSYAMPTEEDCAGYYNGSTRAEMNMFCTYLKQSLSEKQGGQQQVGQTVADQPPNVTNPHWLCGTIFSQSEFRNHVTQWRAVEARTTRVLSMLLGFYVATMMARWWTQICKLPEITGIAMTLNALVTDSAQGEAAALDLKKRILKYCLLSYAMLLKNISRNLTSDFEDNFETIMMQKDLVSQDEMAKLKTVGGDRWTVNWWVPLNWCNEIVNEESSGSIPKEGKEVVSRLIKYKQNLDDLERYYENPMPALCHQAVYVVCWGFLIFGAFTAQECECETKPFWKYLMVSPLRYQCLLHFS